METSVSVRHDLRVHLVDLPDKFPGQQLLWLALSHDLAVLHGKEPITVHGGDIQIVDGGDDRPVQPPHQIHQLELVFDVQMVGTILSILITWALENAIETADSMKSRGYGLPGRTAFSIYRLDSRDKAALLWLGFCGFFIVSGWMAGGFYWRYYPTIKGAPVTSLTAMMHLCYLALCLTPVILDRREEQTWERLDKEGSSCGT